MTQPVQPIRPAATVILVREAVEAYEILMLKRSSRSAFAGGMYVFPGGRVDADDHLQRYATMARGPTEHQARQVAAVGHEYLGFWVACVRECFEEAGILLAYDAAGQLVTNENHPELDQLRDALNAGQLGLDDVCEQLNLTLALDRVHLFNRWVTPAGRPRRFDTRFFIARAPDEQADSHDAVETVDSVWITPSEALARNAAGEFDLMSVTVKQLTELATFRHADDVVAMSESRTDFPVFRPVLPAGS